MKIDRKPFLQVNPGSPNPVRRRLLRYGVNSLGAIAAGKLLVACRYDDVPRTNLNAVARELHRSNVDGLLLPDGFTARIVARTGEPVVPGGSFRWHAAPDGGAVFPSEDGGWVYVSNSEMNDGAGGASAIRFDSAGEVVDAYPILEGTHRNCAGGPTPWNTWLSCEEVPNGHVWECDPFGRQAPRELPALGTFMHEAVAVDPRTLQLYLTEDRPDGRLYRFTPGAMTGTITSGMPDLREGLLEVAETANSMGGDVQWHPIEDPTGAVVPTREQVAASAPFAGGEGAWHADGTIYFTTKHDNRVWAYAIEQQRLDLIYNHDYPVLTGVDNITVSQAGVVYVAEDGGNMQIVAIDPEQKIFPILQLIGHEESEITGPAFDASGMRLYFSSQRGADGSPQDGITYEVTGPFG